MSHGYDLLRHLRKAEERASILRYDEQLELMPKTLSHPVSAAIVDTKLETDWTNASGKFKTDYPVPCRIFNVSAALGPPPEELFDMPEEKLQKQARQMYTQAWQAVADLKTLGVQAFVNTHQGFYKDRRNKLIDQTLVCLPNLKMKADKSFAPDIDGAAFFLAYLLKKGWMQEAEIPRIDVEGQRLVHHEAFGATILALAKTLEVQAKVNALDLGRSTKEQGIGGIA